MQKKLFGLTLLEWTILFLFLLIFIVMSLPAWIHLNP